MNYQGHCFDVQNLQVCRQGSDKAVKCLALAFHGNIIMKSIMVLMESVVSGHKFITIRERLADKLEMIRYDPYIQDESLYRERKKIRSIKSSS